MGHCIGCVVLIFVVYVGVIIFIGSAIIKEESEAWGQYKLDHACKIVRNFYKDGKIISCWECDDGVEYCR